MAGDGNVIKHEDSQRGTPIPFQFDDVNALAKRVLDNASRQSKALLETARKQAVAFEKQAQDDGFKAGHKEGYDKGLAEGREAGNKAATDEVISATESLSATLEQVLQELTHERLELYSSAESDLLALAVKIARQVVKRQILIDDEIVLENVREAIKLAVERRDIKVLVNPADLAAVENFLPQLKNAFTDLERVSVEADDSITRGGARLVQKDGTVDLRIEEQLAALERSLLGSVGEGEEEQE